MRLLFLLLLTTNSLFGNDLYDRLRLIVPGTDAGAVNERQYLYQRMQVLFEDIEAEKRVHKKRKKKRIKRIGEYVEEHFLQRHDPAADLDDVLRRGSYNDASIALLLGLLFERYDLEYATYIDHYKIYTVADPSRRKVTMYFGPHAKMNDPDRAAFRRDYLAALQTTLRPGEPEFAPNQTGTAFTTNYYAPDRPVTFGQIAAFGQYQRALEAYGAGRHERAKQLAEAALRREDRTPFLLTLRAAELQLAGANTVQLEGSMEELFAQWRGRPAIESLPPALLHKFDEEQRLILTSNAPEMTEQLLERYLAAAPAGQADWRRQMRQLQQLRLLSHYHKNGQTKQARELASRLQSAWPEEERFRHLLGEVIVDDIRRARLSGVSFTENMRAAVAANPFLQRHDRFIDLYLRELALQVRDLFAADRPNLAAPALEDFRTSLIDLPIGEGRNLWTLTAFISASFYHFRVGDYAGAMQYVEEALSYAPDDQFLLHRREILRRYL